MKELEVVPELQSVDSPRAATRGDSMTDQQRKRLTDQLRYAAVMAVTMKAMDEMHGFAEPST